MISLAAKVLRLNCSENSGSSNCQTVCLGGGCGGAKAHLSVHKGHHGANGNKSLLGCQRQNRWLATADEDDAFDFLVPTSQLGNFDVVN
jgi:hypothetical protein